MTLDELAAIRERDCAAVARMGDPTRDPFLRAEMDRRALLAERDALAAKVERYEREGCYPTPRGGTASSIQPMRLSSGPDRRLCCGRQMNEQHADTCVTENSKTETLLRCTGGWTGSPDHAENCPVHSPITLALIEPLNEEKS